MVVKEFPGPTDTFDGMLVQQAAAGDLQAFEGLVKRYSDQLLRLISQYVKDSHQRHDILQQVLLQLYLSLPTLRTTESLKPWLYRVARNRCLDELRRKRPLVLFSTLDALFDDEGVSILEAIPDTDLLPEEQVEAADLSACLLKLIEALPQNMARVMYLRYIKHLSFSEIGHVLQIPEATAKTYCYRARRLLTAQQAQLVSYL